MKAKDNLTIAIFVTRFSMQLLPIWPSEKLIYLKDFKYVDTDSSRNCREIITNPYKL